MSGMGNWELQATDVNGKSKGVCECVIKAAKGISGMLHCLPDNRNLEEHGASPRGSKENHPQQDRNVHNLQCQGLLAFSFWDGSSRGKVPMYTVTFHSHYVYFLPPVLALGRLHQHRV